MPSFARDSIGIDEVPKVVWFYWDQGIELVPELVKLCRESWQVQNPTWELRDIDAESVRQWIDVDSLVKPVSLLPVAKKSDLVRLQLLRVHGGVWVDSTLYCAEPLDKWLPARPSGGFIELDLPKNENRYFSSYFLASPPNSMFLRRWLERFQAYLVNQPRQITWRHKKRLMESYPWLSTRMGAIILTSLQVWDRFGLPYFILHFLANRMIWRSPTAAALWLQRPKRTSGRASRLEVSEELHKNLSDAIYTQKEPVWKLSLRRETDSTVAHELRNLYLPKSNKAGRA